MSETGQAQFTCESCGKSYAWKPQLAGKKAKCKCGAVMQVPQSPPGDDDDGLEGLYDLVEDDPRPRQRAGSVQPGGEAMAGGSQQRCPSCSAGMEPGSVICVTCGFNLKTGKKMNAALGGGGAPPPVARAGGGQPRAMAASALPPGIRPVQMKRANYDYEKDNQKKMLALGGIAILLVGGLVGAFLMLRDAPPAEAMLGDDAAIVAQMEEEDAIPAIELLDKGRLVSGMTTSQAKGYVERLKKMGAIEVYGADRHMTRYLVIELPDDTVSRKALFDYEHRWHTDMHQKPATDVGQKYLKLSMRL